MWNERLSPAGYAFAAVVLVGVLLMVGGDTARPTHDEPPHG